jgi:hypothetical protein
MHAFTELIDQCTAFTLEALKEANERTIDALQTSAATTLVKVLQMIQLQKVILAVGMFSLFESILQDGLSCSNGFREASDILDSKGEAVLKERFNDYQLAINVLKHGHGRSYDALVAKAGTLSFRVRLPGEAFFYEGDVSEVSTLIEVNDIFILSCADVIREVSTVIKKARREYPS